MFHKAYKGYGLVNSILIIPFLLAALLLLAGCDATQSIPSDFYIDGTYYSGGTPVGQTGAQGPTGPQGPAGNDGADGSDGAPGQGFNFHGAYDNSHAYVPYDVVTYQGATYLCTASSTGNIPTNTSYWNVLLIRNFAAQYAFGPHYTAGDNLIFSNPTYSLSVV